MKFAAFVICAVAVSKLIDLLRFLRKNKPKRKKKKVGLDQSIFVTECSDNDIVSYKTRYYSIGPCETHSHPIEGPETLKWIGMALKPPTLPEQKVFENVDDMMDKIG